MKKNTIACLITLSVLAVMACTEKISTEIPTDVETASGIETETPSGLVTIKVRLPETKVSIEENADYTAALLKWQSGDKLTVIGKTTQTFTIEDGFTDHNASFTGPDPGAGPYTIIYPSDCQSENDFAALSYDGQVQSANGNTSHLKYGAILKNVVLNNLDEICFDEGWAAEHNGTLSENSILQMLFKLPASVTKVYSIYVVSGNIKHTLWMSGSEPNDKNVIKAYMMIPDVTAGSNLSVRIETAEGSCTGTFDVNYTDWKGGVQYTVQKNLSSNELDNTNPMQIRAVCSEDLVQLAAGVNNGIARFQTASVTMDADTDLSGTPVTIGVFNTNADNRIPFKGTFDGNDKIISNNVIGDVNTQGIGLFTAVEGATIQNLKLVNCKVTGKSYAGSLVGWINGGTISTCSVSGSEGYVKSPGGATGGVVGYVYNGATISQCNVSEITVGDAGTPSGNNYGGVVGYANNSGVLEISGCQVASTCSIGSGPSNGQVGGIVGSSQIQGLKGLDTQYLYISACTNAASINPGTRGYAGGIIGIMNGGTVTDCRNTGNVSASDNNQCIGGIAGYLPSVNTSSIKGKGSEIINCLSDANISGNNKVGGIVGFIGWGAIQRCTSKGSVTGAQSVGGIVGEAQSGVITSNGSDNGNARIALLECLAKASVKTTKGTESYTGGVVGYLHSSYSNNSAAFATIGSCAAQNTEVKNSSNSGCSHLGGFVGYVTTAVANIANNNRVRMYYCYAAVEPNSGYISGPPSKFGGFVGYLERGNTTYCYYTSDTGFQDATMSTNNVTCNHLDKKTANEIAFTTAQVLGTQNLSNGREGYTVSAWTTSGKNGETLALPLPEALVALGTEYYE